MISQVTSGSAVSSVAQQAQPQPKAKPAVANAPQDSVQLSKQALAASGDVDHDGDSH
jgi:hypothetical protein